jgi:flagellar hook-associated protein 3 FlgL
MTAMSVGDLAQHFTSMRNGSLIKSELARLSDSLSSGKVADITRHLGGETAGLAGLEYSLTQLDAYAQTGSETQQYLAAQQTILTKVDDVRSATAARLLLVSDASTVAQVDEAAASAQSSFESVVRSLNTQIADRSVMGGANVANAPLASADQMLTDIQTAIGGALDAATIIATVDDWFDDPGGGFATMGYVGDTGPTQERRVSETRSVGLTARADNPAFVAVLKSTALAALANDMPALDADTKRTLLQEAGADMFGAASDLVGVQARVGFAEAQVADALAENAAQQTGLGIARNDLISADPFDTASRLQQVQLQLETHYAVTARLSQLSLLRYI